MRQLHVAAFQFPHQLHVMIAGNTKCCSFINHLYHEPQHLRNSRSAVYKIANEDSLPAIRRDCLRATGLVLHTIAELGKQGSELLKAPMNVPDDVEGTMLMLQVVPERLPGNLDSGNF